MNTDDAFFATIGRQLYGLLAIKKIMGWSTMAGLAYYFPPDGFLALWLRAYFLRETNSEAELLLRYYGGNAGLDDLVRQLLNDNNEKQSPSNPA